MIQFNKVWLSLLSGQYFALEKSAFKRIGIYDWQEEFNDSI